MNINFSYFIKYIKFFCLTIIVIKMNVSDVLKNCKTGDILLYHTTYSYSRAIEYCTGSKFSHISFIVRDPTYLDDKLNGIYIIEAAAESIPDAITGKKKLVRSNYTDRSRNGRVQGWNSRRFILHLDRIY